MWPGGRSKASDEMLLWQLPGTIHEIDMRKKREGGGEKREKEESEKEETEIEKGRKKKPKSDLVHTYTYIHPAWRR